MLLSEFFVLTLFFLVALICAFELDSRAKARLELGIAFYV